MVTTMLVICEAFHISIGQLVTGLDRGIYKENQGAIRSLKRPH